ESAHRRLAHRQIDLAIDVTLWCVAPKAARTVQCAPIVAVRVESRSIRQSDVGRDPCKLGAAAEVRRCSVKIETIDAALLAVRQEELRPVLADRHAVVEFCAVVLAPETARKGEAVQMPLLRRRTSFDRVEHDPYPKPSGMIANSFVEPEKHRVEKRRRKQIELAVRESKAVQSMTQRND